MIPKKLKFKHHSYKIGDLPITEYWECETPIARYRFEKSSWSKAWSVSIFVGRDAFYDGMDSKAECRKHCQTHFNKTVLSMLRKAK
jgi:hypothetical protein